MTRHGSIIISLWALCLLCSCAGEPTADSQDSGSVEIISGEAQGTTYSVKFLNPENFRITKDQVDSLLVAIDQSLSTWVPSSTISKFNESDSIVIKDPHFITLYFRGKEISELTSGAFHPMVMPLARAWGFGPEGGTIKENANLDSLKALVNFDMRVEPLGDAAVDNDQAALLFLKKPGQEIDVNSYAQGYAVDVLSEFLQNHGIENYMVEIGGELRARGTNERGEIWRIGIDKPVSGDEQRELNAIFSLKDASLATSGTYRKFYEQDGKKYSHTIDPSTASPVDHNLLSVTVLAGNCTNADAFATAFMVMGVERTKRFIESHPELGLEVYLIYDNGASRLETFTSPGMVEAIQEL